MYLAVVEKQSFEDESFGKKVFRRDIRDFQNAVTFLFEEIEQKLAHFRKLVSSAISMSNLKNV